MRALRLFFVGFAVLALGACVPNLSGISTLFDAPSSASVRYGIARGDATGFDLSAFSTRQVEAVTDGGALYLTVRQGDDERVIQFIVQPFERALEGLRCDLVTGTRTLGSAPCSLIYLQRAGPGLPPRQAEVVRGTLEVDPARTTDAGTLEIAFAFEARLRAPTGGVFIVRGEGLAITANSPTPP